MLPRSPAPPDRYTDDVTPHDEYRVRLQRSSAINARSVRRFREISNARLAMGLVAVATAAASIGVGWIPAWWLLLPVALLIALVVVHERVDRVRTSSARAVSYYERALARLEHRWAGKGDGGEAYSDSAHLYAADLDLFGPGSLFEFLSTARTAVGRRVLAGWLLQAGAPSQVRARQQAVEELRSRLDLREEFALLGEDVRVAVDDVAMTNWGQRPALRFFRGARWVAPALTACMVLAVALYFAQITGPRPVLVVALAELAFSLAVRDAVRASAAGAAAPSGELKLLGLLLERLERESFTSPHLQAITHALDAHGLTPSAEIRRLTRRVECLDWARNQFFRAIASPLLWIPQWAMAIEAWRRDCGPHIGEWVAMVGEFEALCSLACFAYERPAAVFPELMEDGTVLEAEGMLHPLIDPREAVANDVRLDGRDCALWIVSGSNMSGKSTLLRAVGVNAVLAWAGAPVTCARLRLSPLRIGASIRVSDSLQDHRSRFYAEISRLREIVDLARAGQPTLFLLDELLSGTNSHDRRIGAAALIRGLVERGAIGLVTTHDLALADITGTLAERARNVHFEDHLEGGEIRFDFRLRPGVVERSNALELMRAVGLDV